MTLVMDISMSFFLIDEIERPYRKTRRQSNVVVLV